METSKVLLAALVLFQGRAHHLPPGKIEGRRHRKNVRYEERA
jgi:hypothetical protein